MSTPVTIQRRPYRRERIFRTVVSVGTLLVALVGFVLLPILVGGGVLAVSEPLPMNVRLGLVFAAVAVGAFLASLLVDAPFSHTFGRWYEGR